MQIAAIASSLSINFVIDGDAFVISNENPLFTKVMDAYKLYASDMSDDNARAIIAVTDVARHIREWSGGQFYVANGRVVIDGDMLPETISSKVIEFADEDLPYQPLINFWINLKDNPSERSKNELYGFLDANQIPLTPDGYFVAYKAVTKGTDGGLWDTYTYGKEEAGKGTFSNNPGDVVSMERAEVDDDCESTCSQGLHVAAMNYAKNHYGAWNSSTGEGTVLVTVKVNPANVVSVPTDYDNQKMRVCEYEVLSEATEEYTGHLLMSEEEKAALVDDSEDETNFYDEEEDEFIDELDDEPDFTNEDDDEPDFTNEDEGDVLLGTDKPVESVLQTLRADGGVEIPSAIVKLVEGRNFAVEAVQSGVALHLDEGVRRIMAGTRIAAKFIKQATDITGPTVKVCYYDGKYARIEIEPGS